MKRLAVVLLAIAAVSLPLTSACSPPAPEPEPPQSGLKWRVSDLVPEDIDPWVPLIEAREDKVVINLPNWPLYRVVSVEIADRALLVHTTLPDRARKSRSEAWMDTGIPWDKMNLVILEVDGLAKKGVRQVKVLGEEGRVIAPTLSYRGAVAVVKEYVNTDFECPTGLSMTFDLTYGGERLVCLVDYCEAQTLDRAGSNAVSGVFLVDMVTREVLDEWHVKVVPLGHTHQLASGCRLLGWTAAGNVLTTAGSSLLTYDIQGQLLGSVDAKTDLRALEFVVLSGEFAWFKSSQGFLAVDISTGQTSSAGTCPQMEQPPGALTRTQTERTVTTRLEVDVGQVSAVIEALEDEKAGTGQLSAYITREGGRIEVDTSVMGEHVVPRNWDLSPDCGTLSFSTELFGPRYGCWVTDHTLGALDLQTGQMRRVALMPGPGFRLSPCGRYAVYGYGDRVLIVDLRPAG